MIDAIERERAQPADDRQIGNWRIVASAWALLLLFLLLFAGVSAVACPRGISQPHRHLARVSIPEHDPCGGSGIPSAHTIDGCAGAPISENRSAYW